MGLQLTVSAWVDVAVMPLACWRSLAAACRGLERFGAALRPIDRHQGCVGAGLMREYVRTGLLSMQGWTTVGPQGLAGRLRAVLFEVAGR